MAKGTKKYSNSSQFQPSQHNSIGYFIPKTVSKQDFYDVYAEWNAKLEAESFPDIEITNRDGHSQPLFRGVKGKKTLNKSAAAIAMLFDQNQLDYYHMISVFAEHNLWQFRYYEDPLVSGQFAQWLMQRTSEGLTVDQMFALAKTFSRKDPLVLKAFYKFKKSLTRSFLYNTQKKLLSELFEWHRTNPAGVWYVDDTETK